MSYLTLITVVIAALISMSLFGNHSYFGTFNITISWDQASYVAVIVGIICGILGGLFSKVLLYLKSKSQKFSINQNMIVALLSGLIIAFLGHITNGFVFGTGYRQTIEILAGHTSEFSLFLPIAKMMATLASYMSGIPRRYFCPIFSYRSLCRTLPFSLSGCCRTSSSYIRYGSLSCRSCWSAHHIFCDCL